ncbi:hypothetical protein MSAN_00776100 [Mycena sanguinolenta]|uniref:Uncharacterized protein n=1 Tax=Mycena sanguinolenta TaxID=230812 RepID=A0A8H7DEG5_9AGAR|nr:hypothetical protein MSAN_00776100 [Mycena sanguinolenta]
MNPLPMCDTAATPPPPPRKASSCATVPTSSPSPWRTATTQPVTPNTSLAVVLPHALALGRCATSRGYRFLDSHRRDSSRPLGGGGHGEAGGEARRCRALRRGAACAGDGGASGSTRKSHRCALRARPPPRATSRTSHNFRSFADTRNPPRRRTYSSASRRRRSPRDAGLLLDAPPCDSSAPRRWKGKEGRAARGEAMQRVTGERRGEIGQHVSITSSKHTHSPTEPLCVAIITPAVHHVRFPAFLPSFPPPASRTSSRTSSAPLLIDSYPILDLS